MPIISEDVERRRVESDGGSGSEGDVESEGSTSGQIGERRSVGIGDASSSSEQRDYYGGK